MTKNQTGDGWEKDFEEKFSNEYFMEIDWNHWVLKEELCFFIENILKQERLKSIDEKIELLFKISGFSRKNLNDLLQREIQELQNQKQQLEND